MTLARVAQLEAELDLRQAEYTRLLAAYQELQSDFARLDSIHRANLEILQAQAPGAEVKW